VNATNLRGYLRDEVYAFEIVFLLKNGQQTDGFHIPGRTLSVNDTLYPDVPDTNPDFIGEPDYYLGSEGYSPYWKIYNTASVTGFSQGYTGDLKYKGPYQYGEFGYWESTEEYPCNETVWGELSGQKIRHHKFPDVLVSPILETKILSTPLNMVMGNDAVFPIGVKIDTTQVRQLIQSSSLTQEQKDDIVAYKIIRGNRGTNKSVIAKGILRNVNEYKREEETFYFPNYPYNDLREDPFLLSQNNAYLAECEAYRIVVKEAGDLEYTDCNTNKPLVGATVMIEGTKKGTFTNENGAFEIKDVAMGKYKLKISSLGSNTLYKEVEVSVSGAFISLILKEAYYYVAKKYFKRNKNG
jgi:hypothetical protein